MFFLPPQWRPILGINSGCPIRRGRCHEASCKWDRTRRPRARLVTSLPGGPGSPSVPTKRDRPSVGWTRRGRRWAKACRIGGPPRAPSASGSYGPGDRKAAMERRAARTRRQGCPRRKAWIDKDAPLGAPSPRITRGPKKCPAQAGRELRRTRRRKNTGDGACADNDGQGSIARHEGQSRPRPPRRCACSHR